MRKKNRYLIFALLILLPPSVILGQKVPDYQYYDSVTYSLYLSGKWNELIELGRKVIDKGIDYKYLRQRVGYARFIRGDFFESAKDFERALTYDSYDQFTLEYLYYSYLNSGKEDFSGKIVKRFGPELKNALSIKPFKPIESFELEYNFKYSGTSYRSNPHFYRIGLGTKLGYRFSLYQSISDYRQNIELQQTGLNEVYSNRQIEYYSMLKMQIGNHLTAKSAYHFLYNRSGTSLLKGNMLLFSIAPDLKRFSLELSGSVLNFVKQNTIQIGLITGYVFPGKADFYLSSNISGLFQDQTANLIYGQKAGLRIIKKLWIEGNATFGRMTNYNDYGGLYIYNSIDPMTVKSGLTMYIPLNRKISLWTNYSWEKKEFYEDNSFHYNQFSYLGGIRWKL